MKDGLIAFRFRVELFYIRTEEPSILTIESPFELNDNDDLDIMALSAINITQTTRIGKAIIDRNARRLKIHIAILEPTAEYLSHVIPAHIDLLTKMAEHVFAQYDILIKRDALLERIQSTIVNCIELV